MYKLLMAAIGLGGMAMAAPAHASIDEHADLAAAKQAGTIEALEDFLYRHPGAVRAVSIAEAKFECAMGQQWRCGADHQADPGHRGYGG